MAVLLFFTFFSLYLVVGMLIMRSERYLSYRSGVFVFRENSFDPSSIQSGVSHLFHRMAYWGAEISFLEQTRCESLLWFLCSFLFPSAFFTTVAYRKRRGKQERIRVVGKKERDGNSTLRLMLMNTCLTFQCRFSNHLSSRRACEQTSYNTSNAAMIDARNT
jgi:hypothetical protein